MSERYLCIHGHFYQPPRENPWLEEVELQDSAYPYHDWNQRITAECYAPNTASRILDSDKRIIDIVNNYSKISFNMGPTLLSWLEKRKPEVYQAILEADRLSREKFSGHGSAIAQVYNHMIMPLANSRDKYTQVLWENVLKLIIPLSVELDLLKAQNAYFSIEKERCSPMKERAEKGDDFAKRWSEAFHHLSSHLSVEVP